MDKAYFLEDTTSKQQEDLPYDEGFFQVKIYHGYNLTSRHDILDVSNQTNLAEDESQEKATYRETCQEADMTMTLDKTTENAVSETCDKENQCTINLPIPPNQEDTSKSNISDILLHHLCKEEFSKDQGINCETHPEISNNDSFDETIIKNIIVWHVKNSWPTEQSSELTDQLNSKSDDKNSNKPSCSLTVTEENTSDSDELVAAGESSHEENSNFLSKIKSLCDKQKSCLWQTPHNQAEKANSGNKFKYGHSQIYYWFSNFSKVAPKVKIPKNYIIDKPLITDPQASFSPELRDKSAVGQDISESTSRSNYVEKQEQRWETTEPSQLVEVLEKLQGHLELLEQEFLANKEKHLALKEQVSKHKCPAAKDFDPERKADSEIFKLETPLKDFKEKINKSKCTSAVSLPMNSPINLDDLSFISSPPLNEEEPSTASGRQDRAETTSASCAFCLRVLQWEQKMEKKDHRGVDCERFPIAIQDKMLHPDSVLGSDTGYSCCSASRIGLQSSKCENCGTKIHNSQRVCSKEPPKEFHYRYNTPGQNFFNHTERSAFARLRYLNENNSSPKGEKALNISPVIGEGNGNPLQCSCLENPRDRGAWWAAVYGVAQSRTRLKRLSSSSSSSKTHSKPKCICFQRANPKPSNDGCEPIPRKSDLATLSPHSHSCRISENTSSSNFSSNKETESEVTFNVATSMRCVPLSGYGP
ncbi:hypothetical protein MG293_001558 [Ovis ammon polii]|uniref:Protein AKNAD1 n=1 Tax=Ovis ammon polii TaxID=230172 RepID=A0AAD4UL82_OVIAM|nr:hypothetical protein MG293_001558 [Ovis ammon polii]